MRVFEDHVTDEVPMSAVRGHQSMRLMGLQGKVHTLVLWYFMYKYVR